MTPEQREEIASCLSMYANEYCVGDDEHAEIDVLIAAVRDDQDAQIVDALAESSPVFSTRIETTCAICERQGQPLAPFVHDETCAYQRAVETRKS